MRDAVGVVTLDRKHTDKVWKILNHKNCLLGWEFFVLPWIWPLTLSRLGTCIMNEWFPPLKRLSLCSFMVFRILQMHMKHFSKVWGSTWNKLGCGRREQTWVQMLSFIDNSIDQRTNAYFSYWKCRINGGHLFFNFKFCTSATNLFYSLNRRKMPIFMFN